MSITELRRRAKLLGATDLRPSTRKGKKYMVLYLGRWIHFGSRGYSDFTQLRANARNIRRRDAYRARHSRILLKNNVPAYKVPSQPAYWAWHLLW